MKYTSTEEAMAWLKEVNEITDEKSDSANELLNSIFKAKPEISMSKTQFMSSLNEFHPLAGQDCIAEAVYVQLSTMNAKEENEVKFSDFWTYVKSMKNTISRVGDMEEDIEYLKKKLPTFSRSEDIVMASGATDVTR